MLRLARLPLIRLTPLVRPSRVSILHLHTSHTPTMEKSQKTLRSYFLALLTLMGNQNTDKENPPLGWALHWETQSTIYSLPAHRLLRALIQHSPSPKAGQAVAQQFMTVLKMCKNSNIINLVETLNTNFSVSPIDWAAAVHKEIKQNGGNLKPFTGLAELYLNALIIPLRNPDGRTPTSFQPQADEYESFADSDPICIDNNALLESATVGYNHAALEELVHRRDGRRCLISGYTFVGKGYVCPNCTHIIPFSVYSKTTVHAAIEMFTGGEVRAEEVQNLINHPTNAVNMQIDANISMNQDFAWGIEAKLVNNKQKYYFRVVRPGNIPRTIQLNDGDEIEFGKGDDGDSIAMPDPQLCNLHLAIARVFSTSGFAEVVDKIFKDWGDGQFQIEINDEVWCRFVLGWWD